MLPDALRAVKEKFIYLVVCSRLSVTGLEVPVKEVIHHFIDVRAFKSSVARAIDGVEIDLDACFFQGLVEKLTLIVWNALVFVPVDNQKRRVVLRYVCNRVRTPTRFFVLLNGTAD